MTLILTSQTEEDLPYNYQNHFQNTIRIEPNSEIALNHIAINRQRIYKFDNDKIFFISHSHALPEAPAYLRDVDDAAGVGDLANEVDYLIAEDLVPFVQYPFAVIIPAGIYGMEILGQQIESSLNNPNARYGGDGWVNGAWNVTPIENPNSKDFLGFNYDWNSNTNIDLATIPNSIHLNPLYSDFAAANFTYVEGTGTLTKNAVGVDGRYDLCIVIERWMSTKLGVFELDISGVTGCGLFGLSRWTDGVSLMPQDDVGFQCPAETFAGTGDTATMNAIGADFYDYVIFQDDNLELTLYELQMSDDTGNAPYTMEEVNYVALEAQGVGRGAAATVSNTGVTFKVRFVIDNEMVAVEYSSDAGVTWLTLSSKQMKPINNYTCQMTPKVALAKNTDFCIFSPCDFVDPKKQPIRLRPYDSVTRFPLVNGAVDTSSYNHTWAFNYLNSGKRIWDNNRVTPRYMPSSTGSIMEDEFNTYCKWNIFQPDYDASYVAVPTIVFSTVNIHFKRYWWAFTYRGGAAGWVYDWKLNTVGIDYTFPRGNYIIPYNMGDRFFSVKGTMDNMMGIPRFFLGDVEIVFGGKTIASIIGNKDMSVTTTDLLYVRINLGNVLTANGSNNSLSRIISPIVADGETSANVGLRSYVPEKMYLKLNNTSAIMMDHIRVEIVTANEIYAESLGGTTSCSFHIRS